jgi:uncharacterized protein (TIGR00266 family)|nr:TIGR00266 family protein [Kofleriaceae bacterium]
MDHRLHGTTLPVLEILLNPGETVFAESGELSWLTQSVTMKTGTAVGGQKGGIFGALKRAFSGGTFFMTEYSAQGAPGTVAFATKLPGQFLPLQMDGQHNYLVHRHGFVCAQPGVQFSIGFQQSFSAGIFGGEGFMMQKIAGQGLAFVSLGGEVVTYDLQPGETLRVHPGHVGMFQEGVNFQITTVPGIANKLFGGDGMFLAALTGPGRVWLQSLPLPNLAHALVPYLPKAGNG